MEQIISNFKLDGLVILGQATSFLVLLWVLNKFVYIPILKILDERKNKIDSAIKEAEELKKKNEEFEMESEKKAKEANQKVEKIVGSAKEMAKSSAEKILENANKEAEEILKKAKNNAENYKKEIEGEISTRVGSLALLIAENIIKDKVQTDNKYIEEKISELKV